MFTNFNPAERAVKLPADKRIYIGIRPYVWWILALAIAATIGIAWLQVAIGGLPPDPGPVGPVLATASHSMPHGFPGWVRLSHWVNFFFLSLILRSGLSILADHPRLYWNNGCQPGSEWIRFTPHQVPHDRPYTAKDDARYISPVLGLPGYRHSVGIARCWHFLTVPFFILNGVIFLVLLLATDQWRRLVPTSWAIIPDAWNVFVHYATFHWPPEPNGFFRYNALQQLAYFTVVFLLAPVALLTGMAMSPAIENRLHWLPKLFGNRQGARSIHFLVLMAFTAFLIIHILLVVLTGATRNMNHIVVGTDSPSDHTGLLIGAGLILVVIAFAVFAHWLSWQRPRRLQSMEAAINGTLWRLTINRLRPKLYYDAKDISAYFWANGKVPQSPEWQQLATHNFANYRLLVGGQVECPVELSLTDLQTMGCQQQITMHHCIQGWTGIAEWGGVPFSKIVELVKPKATATTVVFYSFGEGLYGGAYYDTHTLDNCLKPGCILAWEMNYAPLPINHGAPLRLRVENQLGYKMVKWIRSIEFLDDSKHVGKGFGGKNEDDEYYDLLADS
jgi:DMSO/TMAO reductase YedYZ molybdopterin-dependent catalytic subunit/thiosulfate reductase cytochrome b subunit